MTDGPTEGTPRTPPRVVHGVFELRNPPPTARPGGAVVPLTNGRRVVLGNTLVVASLLTAALVAYVARPMGWPLVPAALGFAPVAVALGYWLGRAEWRKRQRSWRRDHLREAFGARDSVVDLTPLVAQPQAVSSGVVREWGGEPGPMHGVVRVRWTDPHFFPSMPVEVRVAGRSAGWVGDEPNSIALCMPAGRHALRAWVYREGVASEPLTVEVLPGGELLLELRCNFTQGGDPAPPPHRQLLLRTVDAQEADDEGSADRR